MTVYETEVVVVGGGPIGLASAIEAREAGLDVIVVEPREGVIDKACGEGLMPGAVPALHRLGVAPAGFELRGVAYRDGRSSADHRFAGGTALGVRRTTLHAALLERAEQVGVRRVAARVLDVEQEGEHVTALTTGPRVRGEWMLACDGLHSPVARLLGLHRPARERGRRFGQRQHFAIEPWSDLIEVHWTSDAELYVTPTADGVVGIAALTRRGVRFGEALAACPELAARIARAPRATPVIGAGPFRQTTSARTRGRVLLVGDASGYVDALTGEGLRIGFAQAEAAVQAVRRGDAHDYERRWRQITRDFRWLTRATVALANSPARSRVVPIARAAPRLFGAAVERLAR
ncbi:NAD(P)/FAD-dependent oxidoreductase [uncultured Schumannella sp.]|uniref:NAD(P)/FAD-dependent oxidoreductase n=1 Tax=uncultured Schumannella sp. TaxID=1195956 RepID=UPI0025ED9807|nr:FAD-dependent monooxygenase [uncultured Schumannella sp.]